MLSLFPQILFLSPFAATLIRITLAVFFAFAAWRNISQAHRRSLIIFEIPVAVLLFIGAWTQAVALVGFCGVTLSLFFPKYRAYPVSTTILALVMLATLVVTGPGAFAFDLPL